MKKQASSPTTALTLIGKVGIDEAVNKGAHLSRIVYSQQLRKIRFTLPKRIVSAVPVTQTKSRVKIFDMKLLGFTILQGWNYRFLPERDYATFGSLLSQIRMSSVCRL